MNTTKAKSSKKLDKSALSWLTATALVLFRTMLGLLALTTLTAQATQEPAGEAPPAVTDSASEDGYYEVPEEEVKLEQKLVWLSLSRQTDETGINPEHLEVMLKPMQIQWTSLTFTDALAQTLTSASTEEMLKEMSGQPEDGKYTVESENPEPQDTETQKVEIETNKKYFFDLGPVNRSNAKDFLTSKDEDLFNTQEFFEYLLDIANKRTEKRLRREAMGFNAPHDHQYVFIYDDTELYAELVKLHFDQGVPEEEINEFKAIAGKINETIPHTQRKIPTDTLSVKKKIAQWNVESMAAKNLLLRVSHQHQDPIVRMKATRILIQTIAAENPVPSQEIFRRLIERSLMKCSDLRECNSLLQELAQVLEILPQLLTKEAMFTNLRQQIMSIEEVKAQPKRKANQASVETQDGPNAAENAETAEQVSGDFTGTMLQKLLLHRLTSMQLYGLLREASGTTDPATSGRQPSKLNKGEDLTLKIEHNLKLLMGENSPYLQVANDSATFLISMLRHSLFLKNSKSGRYLITENIRTALGEPLLQEKQNEIMFEWSDIWLEAGFAPENRLKAPMIEAKTEQSEEKVEKAESFSVDIQEMMTFSPRYIELKGPRNFEDFVNELQSVLEHFSAIAEREIDLKPRIITGEFATRCIELSRRLDAINYILEQASKRLPEKEKNEFVKKAITTNSSLRSLLTYITSLGAISLGTNESILSSITQAAEKNTPMSPESINATRANLEKYIIFKQVTFLITHFVSMNIRTAKGTPQNFEDLKDTPLLARAFDEAVSQLGNKPKQRLIIEETRSLTDEVAMSQLNTEALYIYYMRLRSGGTPIRFLNSISNCLSQKVNTFVESLCTAEDHKYSYRPEALLLSMQMFSRFELLRSTRTEWYKAVDKLAKDSYFAAMFSDIKYPNQNTDSKVTTAKFLTMFDPDFIAETKKNIDEIRLKHTNKIAKFLNNLGVAEYFTYNGTFSPDQWFEILDEQLSRIYSDFHSFEHQVFLVEEARIRHVSNMTQSFYMPDGTEKEKFMQDEVASSAYNYEVNLISLVCQGRRLSPNFLKLYAENAGEPNEEIIKLGPRPNVRDEFSLPADQNGFRWLDKTWNLPLVCAGSPTANEARTASDKFERISMSNNVTYFIGEQSKYDSTYLGAYINEASPRLERYAVFMGSVAGFTALTAGLSRFAYAKFVRNAAKRQFGKIVNPVAEQVKKMWLVRLAQGISANSKYFVNEGFRRTLGTGFKAVGGAAGFMLFNHVVVGGVNELTFQSNSLPRWRFNSFEHDPKKKNASTLAKVWYNYGEELAWTTAYYLVMPMADHYVNLAFARRAGIHQTGKDLQAYLHGAESAFLREKYHYQYWSLSGRIIMLSAIMPMVTNSVQMFRGKSNRFLPSYEQMTQGVFFSVTAQATQKVVRTGGEALVKLKLIQPAARSGITLRDDSRQSFDFGANISSRLAQKVQGKPRDVQVQLVVDAARSLGKELPSGSMFRWSPKLSREDALSMLEGNKGLPLNAPANFNAAMNQLSLLYKHIQQN